MALDYRPIPLAAGQLPTLADVAARVPMTPGGYGPPPVPPGAANYPVRVDFGPPDPLPVRQSPYPLRVQLADPGQQTYPIRNVMPPPGPAPDLRTPFQKDWDAPPSAGVTANIQRQQQINDLQSGAHGQPGADMLHRLWGYFTDTPTEATARAHNVTALDAVMRAGLPSAAASAAAAAAQGNAQKAEMPPGYDANGKKISGGKSATQDAASADFAKSFLAGSPAAADPATAARNSLSTYIQRMVAEGAPPASIARMAGVLPIATGPAKATPGKDVAAYNAMSIGQKLFADQYDQAKQLEDSGDAAGAKALRGSAAKDWLALNKQLAEGKSLDDVLANIVAQQAAKD